MATREYTARSPQPCSAGSSRPHVMPIARRFQATIELIPSAVLLVDSASRIRLTNLHMEALFGYAREELMGQPIEVVLPEWFHLRDQHTSTLDATQLSQLFSFRDQELFARHHDGGEMLVIARIARLAHTRPLLLAVSLRRASGVSVPTHKSVGALNPPKYPTQALASVRMTQQMLASLRATRQELARATQAMAVERDQSRERDWRARRAAGEALRRADEEHSHAQMSAARLRRLMKMSPIGIALGEGRVVHEANDAFLRMVGYSPSDMEARRVPWFQRASDEYTAFATVDRQARQDLLTQGWCAPYERVFLRPDGTHLPVLLSAAMLRPEALEWVCFAMDLSEHQRMEHEHTLAQTNELTMRAEYQHLDAFFQIAAHDIRNPITIAKGHVELAQRRIERLATRLVEVEGAQGGALAEQAAHALAGLRETDQHIDSVAQLAAQLFDIASARSGNLQLSLARLDIAALVREQVAAQRRAAPTRTIHLEVPEDSQPVWVVGDAVRLREALTNYITNALKYSAADRPVVVRLETVENLVVVSVEDQGPGLSWEEQSQVWEMLHRASGVEVQWGAQGSMGLGLYIVKHLIELHPGGKVGVESVVGQGSTFWFRLPLAVAEPVAVEVAAIARQEVGVDSADTSDKNGATPSP